VITATSADHDVTSNSWKADMHRLRTGHAPVPTVRISIVAFVLVAVSAPLSSQDDRLRTDWAFLARYRDANTEIGPPEPGKPRVVFYGNSITEGWARHFDAMFPDKSYVGRGISGQTTPQLLVRFRQDVVALSPDVVVILAGTNDIAGNTGPSTLEMIQDNLTSMAELARANGIDVVLCSVLPAYDYRWRPGLEPAGTIVALNEWMQAYAAANDIAYVNYHTAMADERQGLQEALTYDGVHPNDAGYRVMAPLVEAGIAEALRRRRAREGQRRGRRAQNSSDRR
jgi:lysophospholipase L1-like esterase